MPRAVLLAEIENVDERPSTRLLDLARSILGREAILWERSSGFASLTPADRLSVAANDLLVAAAQRLPGVVVTVGCGRVYDDPLALRTSFSEAQRALTVGRHANGPGRVYAYDDLGLSRLLLACPEPELTAFHVEVLGPLLDFESAHPGSDLLLTLQAFLASNRNAAAAARELFVHYNTVRYRLDRIEHLLGPFQNDAGRCLALELALRAGRLLAQVRA
jgi:sugar diacid utilization regulator